MKKYTFIKSTILAAMVSMSFTSYASEQIELLKSRIVPDLAQQEADRFPQSGTSFQDTVSQLISSMNPDGTWSDIDYEYQINADELMKHGERMLTLAAGAHYDVHPEAQNALLISLQFWAHENRENSSWWWNDIGIPRLLGPILLILGDKVPEQVKSNIVRYMPDFPSKTGANKSDISTSVIYKGLLNDNEQLVDRGINGLLDVIEITNGEGIQKDYSFHQHGKQLYSGGYGETFIKSLTFWAYHVRDLQWAFPAEKREIVVNYFLDGVRWLNWNGVLDYNVEGRGISRKVPLDNPILRAQTQYVQGLTEQRKAEAEAFQQHVNGGVSGLNGFKSFWRSDYVTKLADDHFIGIKMNSNRTEPNEYGNGENKLGFWLGFGSMFLMQDGDEYHEIFPVWDWKFVPGVTAPVLVKRPALWGKVVQSTTFTGGVTDGNVGVGVFDMNYYSTQAKKAWFSFNDEVVALGAGITSQRGEHINTTVNQTSLDGPVTVDGRVYQNGARQLVNAKWVHHDNVGYVFPENWYGQMSNNTHSGNWNRINSKYSNELVQKEVFTLRIGHGIKPTDGQYQYIILPNSDVDRTAQYAQNSPVQVVSNTSELQSVTHSSLGVTGAVFYQPGLVQLADGTSLSVDHQSVVMFDETNGTLSVSTPGVAGAEVNISLSSPKLGHRNIAVITPSLVEDLGKSVVVSLNVAEVYAQEDAFVRGGRYANTNYSDMNYLVVKNDNDSYDRKAVLKFDLSDVDTTDLSSSILKMKVRASNTDSSRQITVSRLSHNDWTQESITWNSLPTPELVGPTVNVSSAHVGEWVEFDVSSLLTDTSHGVVSLLLENRGEQSGRSDVSFFSTESDAKPTLILNH
ncbi:polysaccharide lyase family 8 super-sandwich domain-containing protein [Vibrio sp. TRT 17S01]|uniref:polysaccharide lyase family 8 super-sandwich domain-containing protein n=1 Tax=Vibrio sp. TRT 17S01 TaxID=3418505 RepID=UPI003CF5799C